MDERKRKSGTGPGGKLKGDHLWNSCGSEAGKDERKPSESQVRELGENGWETSRGGTGKARKRKRRRGTGEATERQKREERKGRNRRLSSRKESGSGRKEAEAERKMLEGKVWQALVEQLWERSEEGRKETNREPSTRTWKGSTGNRAEEKGESQGSESGEGAPGKPL